MCPTPAPFAKALAHVTGARSSPARNGANLPQRHAVLRSRRNTCRRRRSSRRLNSITSRYDCEIPVHVGLDQSAEGRYQHARHADGQPAAIWSNAGRSSHESAVGAGGLAPVESHLRQQLQFQSGAAAGGHALYRCRQAGAGTRSDRRSRNLRDDCADDLFQRAGRLWRALLPHLESDDALARHSSLRLRLIVLCGRSLAAGYVGASRGAVRAHHRPSYSDDIGLGHDRNITAGYIGAYAD